MYLRARAFVRRAPAESALRTVERSPVRAVPRPPPSALHHRLDAIRVAPDVPIQRLMARDAFVQSLGGVGSQLLTAVGEQIDVYRAIQPNADANGQLRLRALRELDKRINVAHAANQQPPASTGLIALYRDSEAEHRDLVAAIVEGGQHLPVDTTGIGNQEQQTMLATWQQIVAGGGNLRIKGGGQFRNRMLASVAKLMQGQYGRGLITAINAHGGGENQRVTLGSDFAAELQGTQRQQGAGSEAIPLSDLQDANGKPYEFKVAQGPVAENQVRTYQGNTPEQFDDFLRTLDRPYFKFGDTIYQPGAATGSLVRITDPASAVKVGTNDNEVLSPEFVTVGHELGHAARMLRGQTTSSTMRVGEHGVRGMADEQLWSSAEELLNITGVENRIRGEHDIGARKYHVGSLESVRHEKNKEAFETQKAVVMGRIPDPLLDLMRDTALWNDAMNAPFLPIEWANGQTAQSWNAKLTHLDRIIAPLHRVFTAKTSPAQLEADANSETRRKMRLDPDFIKTRSAFNSLLQTKTADPIVGGIGERGDQLARIAHRLMVEAATESSSAIMHGGASSFDFGFGGF